MKVKLQDDYRKIYTLEDLDRAKAVIQAEKDLDEETPKGWAEYAAREALKETGDYLREIISAEAHTAKNCRAWNAYGEETEAAGKYARFLGERIYRQFLAELSLRN